MTKEEALYFKNVIGPAILGPILIPTGPGQIDMDMEIALRRAYERALAAMAACPPSSFIVVNAESLEVPEDIIFPPVTNT